jgi:DNA-binding CsgD family transcriptional regulator
MTGSMAPRRVERICASATDARSLRLDLLDELRRTIGFDAYAWLLTDPETTVGCAPLANVPCLPELPRLIRLKYLTTINRWTTLTSPVRLSDSTGGELSKSLLWRDLLAGYGIVDIASVAFTDRFGTWGFLDLWRTGTSARFTSADVTFLADITEPVTAALRHCQANTFIAAPTPDTRRLGPIVLLLSPDLHVLDHTPETPEYLRILVPPDEGNAPIPAGAYNVAAQLLAAENAVDHHPALARVHLSGGLWVTLRAARIGTNIAVTIEETAPVERLSLFTKAFGLSARETELLNHLVSGADTREVATKMYLSEHTVQTHLKSIFTKTTTRSRRTLLTRVLGAQPDPTHRPKR